MQKYLKNELSLLCQKVKILEIFLAYNLHNGDRRVKVSMNDVALVVEGDFGPLRAAFSGHNGCIIASETQGHSGLLGFSKRLGQGFVSAAGEQGGRPCCHSGRSFV